MTEAKNALIDARGMSCPIPLLKARQALMVLEVGDLVTVLSTDPASPADFEAFCEESTHELVDVAEADGMNRITLRKG
ncbi:MAG: sulfurtransferase TusA family protein [Geminicoccaceae bacterium]